MIILLSGIFLIGVGLAVYAFFPSRQDAGQTRLDEPIPLHLPPETMAPKPAAGYDLTAEFQQLKGEHKNLAENIDQLKKENAQLKDELLAKGKELEKSVNQVSSLNRELKDNKDKLEAWANESEQLLEKVAALEEKERQFANLTEQASKSEAANKENTDLADKIKLLETQVAEYKKEEVILKAAIQSKEAEEIKKTEAFQKENIDIMNKIKVLEAQVEQYKKEIEQITVSQAQGQPKLEPQDSVPRKEYEELKKKLQEAEEILRLVHGAGQ